MLLQYEMHRYQHLHWCGNIVFSSGEKVPLLHGLQRGFIEQFVAAAGTNCELIRVTIHQNPDRQNNDALPAAPTGESWIGWFWILVVKWSGFNYRG